MMNAEAAKLGLRDTHFANPDGLDAPGHYSSARDVTRLARIAMKNPVIRRVVGEETARDLRRTDADDLERPARDVSRPVRRQDRAHDRRRLVGGRCGAVARGDRLRDAARRAPRATVGTTTWTPCSPGA